MNKKQDKRLFFVAQALNKKLTDDPRLANAFYKQEGCEKLSTDDAIAKFREWLS